MVNQDSNIGPINSVADARRRLYCVQWIRILLTVLVVAHHAAQPYVNFVYNDWQDIVPETAKSEALTVLFVFNRTFFMGFFFLISGYFLDQSLARHGAWGVIRDRLIRLGIPLIVIVVFVFGTIGFLVYARGLDYFSFIVFGYLGAGKAEFGHLWFIAHLLLYILVYVGLRALVPRLGSVGANLPPPGHLQVALFVIGLGVVTALVRLVWPIDEWVRIAGILPAEPAHLPIYISLFATGVLAGRARWLDRIETRVAFPWFASAAIVFSGLAAISTAELAQPGNMTMRIAWAFLEPVVGIGIILGLIVFFRRLLSSPSPLLPWIDGNIYGVYLFHLFAAIGLQAALLNSGLPVLSKFAIVLVGALVISYVLTALLRLIPGVRRVL